MSTKACPRCGLTNPASAQRCDCGFNFVSGAVHHSDLSHKKGADLAQRAFVLALCSLFLMGIVLAPVALYTAGEARRHQLTSADEDKVHNARIIAFVVLALWAFIILVLISRLQGPSS
jgi:hypothetical protein